MSENIGELECHICGALETAFIRKKKKGGGNYPLYLWHSKTGPQFYNKADGQDWILSEGIFYDEKGNLPEPEKEPEIDPVTEPEIDPVTEPEIEPVTEPEEKAKNEGWLM